MAEVDTSGKWQIRPKFEAYSGDIMKDMAAVLKLLPKILVGPQPQAMGPFPRAPLDDLNDIYIAAVRPLAPSITPLQAMLVTTLAEVGHAFSGPRIPRY